MNTKEQLIQLADALIRAKGYNSFSFKDLSDSMGIKTASIHYHFPTKADLGIAVIENQLELFKIFQEKNANLSPEIKLKNFLSIYNQYCKEKKICLVGSLSSDFDTIDNSVQESLQIFCNEISEWLTKVLDEGKKLKKFRFNVPSGTQALLIITNVMAGLQLARVTNSKNFDRIQQSILNTIQ